MEDLSQERMMPGRPPLTGREPRRRTLRFAISPREEAMIREAAAFEHKTLSEWMRDVVMREAQRLTREQIVLG